LNFEIPNKYEKTIYEKIKLIYIHTKGLQSDRTYIYIYIYIEICRVIEPDLSH